MRILRQQPALLSRPIDGPLVKKPDSADWLFQPSWKRPALPVPSGHTTCRQQDWLVFLDECGCGLRSDRNHKQGRSGGVRPAIVATGELPSLAMSIVSQLRPPNRRDPGPGEVEIRVRATALNFADVLKAVGVFPEAPFGMECAGVVDRVGAGVTRFRPGDEVVAIGPESFRSYVVRDAHFVDHKPEFLSMPEAVTLPAAFMTAWHRFIMSGSSARGEKVLIHAASGGVGLAAVQVARLSGAEIFATAGSDEKRAFLKSIGIRHVLDSRSLGFADEVMRRTRGQGVDVVLNSLTGDFIRASLSGTGNWRPVPRNR